MNQAPRVTLGEDSEGVLLRFPVILRIMTFSWAGMLAKAMCE